MWLAIIAHRGEKLPGIIASACHVCLAGPASTAPPASTGPAPPPTPGEPAPPPQPVEDKTPSWLTHIPMGLIKT